MYALTSKRLVLVIAAVATVLAVGCAKDKDDKNDIYVEAQKAYSNCVARLRPYGTVGYCSEAHTYNTCSLYWYVSGSCGSTGYPVQNFPGGYGPYSISSYFSQYLRQFPAYEIQEVIRAYNLTTPYGL
jgi:hypothetical protein